MPQKIRQRNSDDDERIKGEAIKQKTLSMMKVDYCLGCKGTHKIPVPRSPNLSLDSPYNTLYLCSRCSERGSPHYFPHGEAKIGPSGRVFCPQCGSPARTRPKHKGKETEPIEENNSAN